MEKTPRPVLLCVSALLVVGLAACDKWPTADSSNKNASSKNNMDSTSSQASTKTGMAIDDTAITTKVKAAIFVEPDLKMLQISVDTAQGVVTLSGAVDSASNRDKANAVAGSVAGVKQVENQLTIKTTG